MTERQPEYVEIPEWGGGVYVRDISREFRAGFEVLKRRYRGHRPGKSSTAQWKDARALCLKLCAQAIVDEHGNQVLNENDMEILRRKNRKVADRIMYAVCRVSGLSGFLDVTLN